MKKFISLLLALVMALSLCATAWADETPQNLISVAMTETGKLEDAVKAAVTNYSADSVTALKISTPDGVYMDSADFAYLKTLKNLTYLDFAEADCANGTGAKATPHTIPDNALGFCLGMK